MKCFLYFMLGFTFITPGAIATLLSPDYFVSLSYLQVSPSSPSSHHMSSVSDSLLTQIFSCKWPLHLHSLHVHHDYYSLILCFPIFPLLISHVLSILIYLIPKLSHSACFHPFIDHLLSPLVSAPILHN